MLWKLLRVKTVPGIYWKNWVRGMLGRYTALNLSWIDTVAILKRPRRKAFPSDIIRQAAQIEKEAQILSALANHDSSGELARVPILKDKSKPGTEYSDRYFIVLSPASGISLAELSRLAHFQSMPADIGSASAIYTPLEFGFHRKNRPTGQAAGSCCSCAPSPARSITWRRSTR